MADRLLRLLALFTLTFAAVAAARAFGTLLPLPMELTYYEARGSIAHVRIVDAERGARVTLLRFEGADTQKAPLSAGWLDHDRLLLISGGTERAFATWTLADGVQPLNDLPLTCRLLESRVSLRGDSVACTTFDQQSVMIQRRGEEAWEYLTNDTLLNIQLSADGRYLLLDLLDTRQEPRRIFEIIDVHKRESAFSYESELLLSGTASWSANEHWFMFSCNTQELIQVCLLDLSTTPPQVTRLDAVSLMEYFVSAPDDIAYLLISTTEFGYPGGNGMSMLEVRRNATTLRLHETVNPNERLIGVSWSPDGAFALFATQEAAEIQIHVANVTQPDSVWTIVRGSRIFVDWRPCPEAGCSGG